MRKLITTLILIGISLHSCIDDRIDKALDYEENNLEREYKTTYHIELSDGRTLEGVSNDGFGGFIYHDYGNDEHIIPLNAISEAEDMTFGAGLIIAGGELLPLGSETIENSGNSVMILNIVGEGAYVSQEPFIGSHSISNLQIHDFGLGWDKATFRYDFNDIVLRKSMESEELTVSGYVVCEVK